MLRRQPRSTRTDTPFPYTTLFRSSAVAHECEILAEIVDGDGTATQRLRDAVESFARRALQGPYLAYAFIAEPADPDVEAARIRCRRDFGDVFKRLLRKGIASGEFPHQSVRSERRRVGRKCV